MLINQLDTTDTLFLTLSIVLLTTNLIYKFMTKFNRPIVLGGLIAGIIINYLNIPKQYFNINTCNGLGQLGIVLFMMLVGNQLNYKNLFRHNLHIPILFLNSLIPFILGFIYTGYLIKHNYIPYTSITNLYTAASKISFNGNNITNAHFEFMFEIFVGLAVSMTAFPLVSMFLNNANLTDSKVGRIALLCGFVNEIFFWIVLGLVLVTGQKDDIINSFKPFYIIFYLLFIVYIAPKLLNFIIQHIKTETGMIAFMIIGCCISSALSDAVNLYPIFGGFLFGLILPKSHPLIDKVRKYLINMVNVTLLPIYFVQTGIIANIHISLDFTTMFLVLIFTLIAFLGKSSGSFITGKIIGLNTSNSLFLGSLLNMRGIIEIVLLNIGLTVGIINEHMYTVLVGMTMICTFIATIMSLNFTQRLKKNQKDITIELNELKTHEDTVKE
ncbi:MAG: cation:proton antiporter [Burkholderiales bacterium]|nr:cation:proton antiporter [Burkholderiales bacterium]